MLGCVSTAVLSMEYNAFSRVEASSYTVNNVPKNLNLNDTNASDIRNYYSSLNTLSASERQGTNLLKNLKPILKNGQKYFSYGSSATTAVWQAYEIVDRDWVKSPASQISGYNSSTGWVSNYSYGSSTSKVGSNPYIHALYVNRSVDNQTRAWSDHSQTNWGINQEHTWPKSLGFDNQNKGTGARGDLMHLWAGNGRVNGVNHNNYIYGFVDTTRSYSDASSYASYLSGNRHGKSRSLGGSTTVFEPQDSDKGDIARAMFYMAARYNYLSGSDPDGIDAGNPNLEIINSLEHQESFTSTTTEKGQMGILQDLLEWNRLDPPDEWEIHRNNLCYNNFTNNRNPFIDFPEWAEYIWGTSVSGTYSSTVTGYAIPSSDKINTFGNATDDTPRVNAVNVSPSTLNLDLNSTASGNLTATVIVSNGADQTINWSSSNNNVAIVSSDGTVTAVGGGTCTITATSTFDSSKSGSCKVTVIDSTVDNTTSYTWDMTVASYEADPTDQLVTWSSQYVTVKNEKNTGTKVTNYLGGLTNNDKPCTQSRFYKNNILTISPDSNYEITSVVFTAVSSDYAKAFNDSTWTNATSTYSGSTVTITPTDGTQNVVANITGTCGFTSMTVNFVKSSVQQKSLESISLDTTNVKNSYLVYDDFSSNGLIVTAYYSDGTSSTVEPTDISYPDMSTSGNKTVTVTYTENEIEKTANFEISVSEPEITSITASVEKAFHPGDVLLACDITVTDNLGNDVSDYCDFECDEYQFTYADAPNGGTATIKTFEKAVSYNDLTCDVVVNVSRTIHKNVSPVTDTLDKTTAGISGTSYVSWSGKNLNNGITYAGQSAGGTSYIQLRSTADKNTNEHAGIISTANVNSIPLLNVSVKWNGSTYNERELAIYGDTIPYSSPNELFGNTVKGTYLGSIIKGTSTSLNISGTFQFIGIKSVSGALYLDEIAITYGSNDTATNVANYIMFEDQEGQCEDNFGVAKGYFEGLTSSEQNEFMTSDEYVIATARERLTAWALHHGMSISNQNGAYVFSKLNNSNGLLTDSLSINNNDSLIIIFMISTLATSALSAFYLIKRKKDNQ